MMHSYNILTSLICNLVVEDADGDDIRCRWANGTSECGGVCSVFSNVTLNESECAISYDGGGRIGLYAAALQIEDFISVDSSTPLSSVPLQFLFDVSNSSTDADPPELVDETLPDGECITVSIGTTFRTSVVALVKGSDTRIVDFITSSPVGLTRSLVTQSAYNSSLYYTNITWTPEPSQLGRPHILCYAAEDSNELRSDRFCITLKLMAADVSRRVNDSAIGDPLMTVPLYLTNTSALYTIQLEEDEVVNLCFEVHGEAEEYFNLVSDSCISVNAHYRQATVDLDYNIIDEITIRAIGQDEVCRNISVIASGCQANVDGSLLNGTYISAGISIRMYRDRVRIAAPNCQDLDLVMWVFCEQGQLQGYPEQGEPDITVVVDMIHFVISRGFNLRETAHGILGQFWNIPIDIERYSGPLRDGSVRDDTYIVTINYPERERRQFLSILHSLTWDKRSNEYCLYGGDAQGGRIYEQASPNDPVIEGVYTDYMITEPFGVEFPYSHFDSSQCGP